MLTPFIPMNHISTGEAVNQCPLMIHPDISLSLIYDRVADRPVTCTEAVYLRLRHILTSAVEYAWSLCFLMGGKCKQIAGREERDCQEEGMCQPSGEQGSLIPLLSYMFHPPQLCSSSSL